MLRLNSIYIYDTILDLSSNSDVLGTSVRTKEYVTWLPTAATFFQIPKLVSIIYTVEKINQLIEYDIGDTHVIILYIHTPQGTHPRDRVLRPYGMQKRHTAWCVSHDAFFF
jgi:hypothetical protein